MNQYSKITLLMIIVFSLFVSISFSVSSDAFEVTQRERVELLPLFDLPIPLPDMSLAEANTVSVSSTASEPVKIIVTMKDPSQISLWDDEVSQMNTQSKNNLKVLMREYAIQKSTGQERVKHKFSSFNGYATTVSQEELAKLRNDPFVASIEEDGIVHAFLQDSVPLIGGNQTWSKHISSINLTGTGQTVCIIDTGVEYTHREFDTCSPTLSSVNAIESYSLTSPNYPSEYSNNYDYTWTITKPGYTSISVFFNEIDLEDGFDYLDIFDENDNLVAYYTGSYSNTWSPVIPGDTIKIRLDTDISNEGGPYSGFKINSTRDLVSDWSSCSKIIGGHDFANDDMDPMDDEGHGSHVAGIVAANDWTQGVAPDANLVAVKALDSDASGYRSDIVAGIEYCTGLDSSYNVSVISMSLGGSINYSGYCDGDTPSYASAIDSATAAGISVIVASGNEGNHTSLSSPACIQNAIPVGSTTKADVISSFSNRNSLLQLFAPGSSILSLELGNAYASKSGTSMSAPHVAGAYAIMNQYLDSQSLSKTPAQIETIFSSTGTAIVDTGYSDLTYSRINLLDAIQSLDIVAPIVTITSPSSDGLLFNETTVIEFSASDSTLQSCKWTNNSGVSNTSFNCSESITGQTWAQGSNTVTVYATDIAETVGSATRQFTVDSAVPNLTLIYPASDGLNFTEMIAVNYTVSDENLDSCWYSVNGDSNVSLSNCANMTEVTWSQGLNTLTIYVNDSVGHINSSTRTFNVDTLLPVLENVTSNTVNGFIGNELNFTLYYSELNPSNISLLCVYNISNSSAIYSYNDTTLDSGNNVSWNHSIDLSARAENSIIEHCQILLSDELGNSNGWSDSTNYTIDRINPTIEMTTPLVDGLNFTEMIDVNYTVSDTNALSCSYSLLSDPLPSSGGSGGSGGGGSGGSSSMSDPDPDPEPSVPINGSSGGGSSGGSIVGCQNITDATWAQGVNNLTIYVSDSYGNSNSSQISFTIDTIHPTIVIDSPSSDNRIYTQMIDVNYTVTDSNVESCWYSLNGSSNVILSSCENITGIAWAQGSNTLIVSVNDTFGNVNSSTRTVTVDTLTPQIVSHISPIEDFIYNRSTKSVPFILNFSESLSSLVYEVQNISFNITGDLVNGSYLNKSLVLPSYGDNLINLTYADFVGHVNSSLLNVSISLYFQSSSINDTDGDGINDTDDAILGNISNVETSFTNLRFKINGSDNMSVVYNQTLNLTFQNANKSVLDFTYNLSTNTLNLAEIVIVTEETDNASKIIVSGLTLPNGGTKTVYFDLFGNKTVHGSICVKDADVISFSELSTNCSAADETYFSTIPSTVGNISLTYTNSSNTTVSISGLSHSGIQQVCTESWSVGSWGACLGSSQTRSVVDANSCGTVFTKPSESQDCSSAAPSSSSGGGGGSSSGGSSSYSLEVDLTTNHTVILNREYDIEDSNYTFTVSSFDPFIVNISGSTENVFEFNGSSYSIAFLGNTSDLISLVAFEETRVIEVVATAEVAVVKEPIEAVVEVAPLVVPTKPEVKSRFINAKWLIIIVLVIVLAFLVKWAIGFVRRSSYRRRGRYEL